MEHVRNSFFPFFSPRKDAPKANELLNLCKETIQKAAQHFSTGSTSTEDYVVNRQQCALLVARLLETQRVLQDIQESVLLDERASPVIQELHQVLQEAETLIKSSRITTTAQLPRSAIEQGEMKETFSKLLYDVQWHTSVLQSILVDNSGESSIKFCPAWCDGQLNVGDELALLTAMKEDDESLKDFIRSSALKLDDPTGKSLVDQLLQLKMKAAVDLQNAHQVLENSHVKEQSSVTVGDSNGLTKSSRDMLFLDPLYLDFRGTCIGSGASAAVREIDILGGKYALKIFTTHNTREFDQEIAVLQGLGHHPHIVRHLCYSQNNAECFLIMEKMDKDLYKVFVDRRRENQVSGRPFSDVRAVALMLQIAEGVMYIHSKGMAHRDLKSGNVLVKLAEPSSRELPKIRSAKIADFGLTKTRNASQTYSNQTRNRGTTKWMAPEVLSTAGDLQKARLNLRKADVYSFAILCYEILTGEEPYNFFMNLEAKQQVKAGTMRPDLPSECPTRLASLIKRCWHSIPDKRPLFPEICRELRYIKGLLLRGDKEILLESPDVVAVKPVEGAKKQGPWGGTGGRDKFFDMATSIKRIKLRYFAYPYPGLALEVEYDHAGITFLRRYGDIIIRDQGKYENIVFEDWEFITQISGYTDYPRYTAQSSGYTAQSSGYTAQSSGYTAQSSGYTAQSSGYTAQSSVVSITIHSNLRSYGPIGEEYGKPFRSATGRIIGFYGAAGFFLDSLGVVICPDDTTSQVTAMEHITTPMIPPLRPKRGPWNGNHFTYRSL